MNEILQKQTEEAAREFNQKEGIPYALIGHTFNAFIEGAKFALQNQWISVGEALPQIREKDIGNRSWSDWVLVMTHGGGAFMDCYAFHRKEWLNNGNDVTHWMSIPSLKGCEK